VRGYRGAYELIETYSCEGGCFPGIRPKLLPRGRRTLSEYVYGIDSSGVYSSIAGKVSENPLEGEREGRGVIK